MLRDSPFWILLIGGLVALFFFGNIPALVAAIISPPGRRFLFEAAFWIVIGLIISFAVMPRKRKVG